eukprot:TRINITY_DN76784_c0_g1_i1.p1 TRINITY_DN76784_c0_g1~~TRINITY_DN76784_c0_g1_i1.p1  ORF type:complete len:242 (+),score=15.96 TRINITY_DN76784_c0_g1_i1:39-764(+)
MASILRVVDDIFTSSLLFPKKRGDALRLAAPEVFEVYGVDVSHDRSAKASLQRSSPSAWRGQKCGRILHLTCHSLPSKLYWARLMALCAFATFWLVRYPLDMKIRSIIVACIYSCTEFTFTFFERQHKPYTSLAQFWGNLLYAPIVLDAYGACLSRFPMLYVLMFPINIWILEIVVGHVIIIIYGYNVAWCYADYTDAFCNDCFRIGHGVWWLSLGLICLISDPLLQGVSLSLSEYVRAFL